MKKVIFKPDYASQKKDELRKVILKIYIYIINIVSAKCVMQIFTINKLNFCKQIIKPYIYYFYGKVIAKDKHKNLIVTGYIFNETDDTIKFLIRVIF